MHRFSLDVGLDKQQIEEVLDLTVAVIEMFVDYLENDSVSKLNQLIECCREMPSVAAKCARPASSARRNEAKSWPKVNAPPLSEVRNAFVSALRFLRRDSLNVVSAIGVFAAVLRQFKSCLKTRIDQLNGGIWQASQLPQDLVLVEREQIDAVNHRILSQPGLSPCGRGKLNQ